MGNGGGCYIMNGIPGTFVTLLDRIYRMLQDVFIFVCIFNFRTKLKIPNRFAKGENRNVMGEVVTL